LDKSVFPTRDNRWVSLHDNPLIADNENLAQLFTQVNNIPLIDIPSPDGKQTPHYLLINSSHSLVMTFFNLCDIKSLSSSITIEHIIENPSDDLFLRNLLSPLIPYIQLFMKSRPEFFDVYQRAKSIDLASILLQLQFLIIDDLQLIYRFKSDPSICIIQNEKSFYDEQQRIFYIHREWIEQSKYYRDIFHAFARIFISDYNNELIRLLGNFLSLLYNEEENDLVNFARYQQFDLQLNGPEDIPWQISSTSKPIQRSEPKIGKINFFRIKLFSKIIFR
jgi:hypothetical protein